MRGLIERKWHERQRVTLYHSVVTNGCVMLYIVYALKWHNPMLVPLSFDSRTVKKVDSDLTALQLMFIDMDTYCGSIFGVFISETGKLPKNSGWQG